jgi:integrase
MARKVRKSGLETRTARLKRPVAKKPEFVKIGMGISLGYRRNITAGAWMVRVSDGKRANWIKAVGQADDYDDANGTSILDYWQAQDLAKDVARIGKEARTGKEAAPAPDKPTTLRSAIDQYEADLKTRGGDVGNAVRVRRHLGDKVADKPVTALTLNDFRKLRDGFTAKSKRKDSPETGRALAPSGINRLCVGLKAALNLAADRDERITSRRPWEQGLATLRDAEESRSVILSDADIRKLLAAAAQGSAFGLLVEGLAVTGARVSQLARINVGDLQDGRPDPRIMVPSSRKGSGKKAIMRRPVPIPPAFAERLRQSCEGKLADAPLFVKASGDQWLKSDHSRPFARIVKAAGVAAEGGAVITSYALRHSSIVRQILANVPVRVVASLHDTSVGMLEKHYSHFIGDHSDAVTRAAMFVQ